jgi:methyl-accepting chemotaxis protein
MSRDDASPQSREDYFKELEAFTKEQQEKVAKVIDEGAKVMADFKPFTMSDDINTQIEALVKTVDDQLSQAMEKVTDQMKQINEKVAS